MTRPPAGADRARRVAAFLAEAKRRRVYVSVVAYIAVSIGVVELGGAIVDALQLPDSTMQVMTILLMLGFPVVVVLAWVFDITMQGVVRTEPRRGSAAEQRVRAVRSASTPVPLPEARPASLRARGGASAALDEEATSEPPDAARLERAALGHMRHELRTPVNGIIGYSEMLLEDAQDPELEADLRRIREGGGDLLARIDTLLSADRWKAEAADADPEAFAARAHAALLTPVTTILGYAELLVETCRERGRDELVPDLERIVAAARKVLETSAGIAAGTHGAGSSLSVETTALARQVLVRIRPVEPGSLSIEGEGRILVVDDNAMNRDLLLRQLARSGYMVDTANDGVEALERIADREYDLILLDVLMPRLDGVETLRRIRADERLQDVPVLMLSSLDEVDSALRCIELGAEEYLPKPFQPTLLAARIAANITLRRLRARDRAYSDHLETMNDAVQRLAHAAFPADVATRVLRGESGIVDVAAAATAVACVLPRAGRPHAPAELVARLHVLVDAIAAVADEHDVETVVMRPYGAVLLVGLPNAAAAHAETAAALALDLLQRVPGCAAGLHTGAVTGGVVGADRPHYDVWGEAVETAEALALGAAAGTLVFSPTTQALVRERYALTAGAVTEVPGHGHMRSYLLHADAVVRVTG
jgi:adenylate cyclase